MLQCSKRLMDIIISGLALIALSPLFVFIIIILKFTGEGEVFYFQKRIGYKKQYFYIWKFATMLKNSPNIGSGYITLRNDPRITTFGKFLRITKLNELPQIINVFKGDMSIVGPRPLVNKTFNLYSPDIQNTIYNLRPGITSIASIVFRDEEKQISQANIPPLEYYEKYISPYKGTLELWYQKKTSVFMDLIVIFITVWVIFFPNSKIYKKVFRSLPDENA